MPRGTRIRRHSFHGVNDCGSLHPSQEAQLSAMIRPAFAAYSSGVGVTAEVTGQAAAIVDRPPECAGFCPQ